MPPEEINEEVLATLHELAQGLPRCKRCGALAVGEFAGTVRVFGSKRYGVSWQPFCEKHPTGEGPIVRYFRYHRAAERYNRIAAELKEQPCLSGLDPHEGQGRYLHTVQYETCAACLEVGGVNAHNQTMYSDVIVFDTGKTFAENFALAEESLRMRFMAERRKDYIDKAMTEARSARVKAIADDVSWQASPLASIAQRSAMLALLKEAYSAVGHLRARGINAIVKEPAPGGPDRFDVVLYKRKIAILRNPKGEICTSKTDEPPKSDKTYPSMPVPTIQDGQSETEWAETVIDDVSAYIISLAVESEDQGA